MRFSKSSVAVGALMVSSAVATPVNVYETEIELHTVTVVAGQQAPAAPSPVVAAAPAPAPPAVSQAPAPAPAAPAVAHSHANGPQTVVLTVDAGAAPAPAQPTSFAVVASAPAPAAPAPAPASSPAPSSQSTPEAVVDSYAQGILDAHNQDRAKHSASPLVWNATLAAYAQQYLDNQNCVFAHSGGPYGENIASGYGSPSDAIGAWYGEVSQYNFLTGLFSEATGHFTQVVWAGTEQIGCAQVSCSGGAFFACEYYPRGNIIGEFLENVFSN
ncbi:Pry2p [Sugiyamaella lignohabitans]|uniref:Pry2p n=1 Tax=Sugiyamaella lignohabitans TaxID=796027 RepID=A0A161HGH2_9ASCO|nr:Pry2p [Sugiyamaella lignohabitans]ANB14850.1 Pry2p [Sugiyamaella lignohabitans]